LKNQNLIKANENLFSQPESAARKERFIRVICALKKVRKTSIFWGGRGGQKLEMIHRKKSKTRRN
jgi:hypothetical protein